MVPGKKALLIAASALLLFAPAMALCEVCDAADIEYTEASIETGGFSFGQQPENNALTVTVLIILTLILVVVFILMLKLRKKMNGGHY